MKKLLVVLAALMLLSACGDPLAGDDSPEGVEEEAPESTTTTTVETIVAPEVVNLDFGANRNVVLTICDHGNRIYYTHEGSDDAGSGITVIPGDPTCPQGEPRQPG